MKFTPKIFNALNRAAALHAGQKRKGDGLPYIVHPCAVAFILSEHTGDEDTIIAGLLHDVLEDVPDFGGKKFKKEFGEKIFKIVKGVSEEKETGGAKGKNKALETLCGQEFSEIPASDKQKQETVYKTIFDVARRNDISDATKALVQQIALSELPASEDGSLAAAPSDNAAPDEFRNTESRQIACNFSCSSNNCAIHQGAEENRKGCLKPIYYPIDNNASSQEAAEQEAQRHINEECSMRGVEDYVDSQTNERVIIQRQCQTTRCDETVLLFPDGKERTVKSCCCSCVNEKFNNKSRRIFDPWDWNGESLIDRLLSPSKIMETLSVPVSPVSDSQKSSFTVSQDACVGLKNIPWRGSGTIIIPDKIAPSNDNDDADAGAVAVSEGDFLNNFQSALEEARRNCPGAGYDSYSLTLMCSVYDFVTGERYSDQYGESGGKCPTSDIGQVEKTDVHTETWTYMASQSQSEETDNTNEKIAEDIDEIEEVEMVITPREKGTIVYVSLKFNASNREIIADDFYNTLPVGEYDYIIQFILKDGQIVPSEENRGHFTIYPCSPPPVVAPESSSDKNVDTQKVLPQQPDAKLPPKSQKIKPPEPSPMTIQTECEAWGTVKCFWCQSPGAAWGERKQLCPNGEEAPGVSDAGDYKISNQCGGNDTDSCVYIKYPEFNYQTNEWEFK